MSIEPSFNEPERRPTMYAISIHQPWAWAILHAGKDVENRNWRTRFRGDVLVHAPASRTSYNTHADGWQQRFWMRLPTWEELARSAIVGVVEVVDCVRSVRASNGGLVVGSLGLTRWAEPDSWCWILRNPRPFAPVPCRGGQRLFHVPDSFVPIRYRSTLKPATFVKVKRHSRTPPCV